MYRGRNKEKDSDNGFIYPLFNLVIRIIEFLNLVNLFKKTTEIGTAWYYKKGSQKPHQYIERKIRKNRNVAVDCFIFFKFGLIWLF